MKIQSGRIQSVGINPGNGLSLGYVAGGLGDDSVSLDFSNGAPVVITPPPSSSAVDAPTFASTQPVLLPGGGYYYPTAQPVGVSNKSQATTGLSNASILAFAGIGALLLLVMAHR